MTANPSDDGNPGGARKGAARRARLEQELRANLTKRKGRMRAEKAKDARELAAHINDAGTGSGENDPSA